MTAILILMGFPREILRDFPFRAHIDTVPPASREPSRNRSKICHFFDQIWFSLPFATNYHV